LTLFSVVFTGDAKFKPKKPDGVAPLKETDIQQIRDIEAKKIKAT
jgi:hypothetical protein|tara:strand:+ start:5439 stop:5573 length:135 start_codon:yes stop_codon:yes gene_type:complete